MSYEQLTASVDALAVVNANLAATTLAVQVAAVAARDDAEAHAVDSLTATTASQAAALNAGNSALIASNASETKVAILRDDLANTTDPLKGAGLVGWSRTKLDSVISNAHRMLDAQAINIWEFASLITNKPTPTDPSTWDWTPAVQAALDSTSSGEIIIYGDIRISRITVQNKSNFVLRGLAGKITIFGAADSSTKNGVALAGVLTNVDIVGLNIECDGVTTNRHAGIFSNSGVQATNVSIYHNRVKKGLNGISCNANLSGFYRNCRIYSNTIDGTVGTGSGEGYGIHFADGSGVRSDMQIFRNTINNATRHSIYYAKGIGGDVSNNVIINHRIDVADGSIRSAINILRSNDVDVYDNDLIEPNDGGIFLGKSALNGINLKARGNRFVKSSVSNNVPLIMVGSQSPSTIDADEGVNPEGSPLHPQILDNSFYIDGNDADMIRVYCALGGKFRGNTGKRVNVAGASNAIFIRAEGGDTYNNDHTYSDNEFDLSGSGTLFRWHSGITGTTFNVRLARNSGRIAAMFAGTAPDNPNISIYDQDILGLSMASGVYANGRYQFKSSVVYDPPSLATLTATSQNLSVANIKANDCVSVNFTQISTSQVLIGAQANANNNVRLTMFNSGATTVDLVSGNVDILVSVNR